MINHIFVLGDASTFFKILYRILYLAKQLLNHIFGFIYFMTLLRMR